MPKYDQAAKTPTNELEDTLGTAVMLRYDRTLLEPAPQTGGAPQLPDIGEEPSEPNQNSLTASEQQVGQRLSSGPCTAPTPTPSSPETSDVGKKGIASAIALEVRPPL